MAFNSLHKPLSPKRTFLLNLQWDREKSPRFKRNQRLTNPLNKCDKLKIKQSPGNSGSDDKTNVDGMT